MMENKYISQFDREDKRENIIEVKNLEYAYPDGTIALENINITVKKGEKIAIMGANGSGKSTFFFHLNGVIKKQKGKLIIDGTEIDNKRQTLKKIRKKVGIIFQDPDNQLFSSNVRQEISFGLYNLDIEEKEIVKKVDNIIKKLNLEEIATKPTHFLSGGQKKRVAIADILVMEPEIICFDEPSASLDQKHIAIVDNIIDKLSMENKTVMVATHSSDRAFMWADRVVLFHKGRIIEDGKPIEVFRREESLKKTNLKKPKALDVFDRLVNNGIIKKDDKAPKDIYELSDLIIENLK